MSIILIKQNVKKAKVQNKVEKKKEKTDYICHCSFFEMPSRKHSGITSLDRRRIHQYIIQSSTVHSCFFQSAGTFPPSFCVNFDFSFLVVNPISCYKTACPIHYRIPSFMEVLQNQIIKFSTNSLEYDSLQVEFKFVIL